MIPGSGTADSYGSGVGSGVVYAAVAVVWAWYLATRLMQARDQRSPAGESGAQRRLLRRVGVESGAAGPDSAPAAVPMGAPRAGRPSVARRRTRRAAVRRRRTVLLLLLILSAGIGVTCALGLLPLSAAVAGPSVALLYLLLGRHAAHRGRPGLSDAVVAGAPGPKADHRREDPAWVGVPFVPAVAEWSASSDSDTSAWLRPGDDSPGPAVSIAPDELIAASGSAPVGSDAWRALPVPLPTYVTAPRVARVVTTIDLRSPGAWTSGRDPVAAAAAAAGSGDIDDGESTEALELPQAATG